MYMTLCICQNWNNSIAQKLTLTYAKLTKSYIGGAGIQGWSAGGHKRIWVTNIGNNLTEGGRKNGSGLSNFGNEWSLWNKRGSFHKHCSAADKWAE